jgi:ubiquinol-cytochrome c reductase cytochrome c1 subunit
MKKLIALLVLVLSCARVSAAGGLALEMDQWPDERATSLESLQNGARLFANYCMGCHSANLMRWNRLEAIGLNEQQIREYLIFGDQKVGDLMKIAMKPADAKQWFGKVPPDLSVIGRARTSFDHAGTDYLYTLLRSYYRDRSSPTGWNNVAYPQIGMPHIFWELQGPREVTIDKIAHEEIDKKKVYYREVAVYAPDGTATIIKTPLPGHPIERIEYRVKPLDADQAREFDGHAADLVAYLAFMTDPSGSSRVRIGVWVLVFLTFFTAIAWWLNGTYWKHVK